MRPYLVPVLLLIASLATLPSCKKGDSDNLPAFEHTLSIDLQGNFNRDQVTVFLDDKKVFSNVIETNLVLGLAATVTTSASNGPHMIKVVVNNNVNGSKTFITNKISKATYIKVRYDTRQIFFDVSNKPTFYN